MEYTIFMKYLVYLLKPTNELADTLLAKGTLYTTWKKLHFANTSQLTKNNNLSNLECFYFVTLSENAQSHFSLWLKAWK